MLAKSILVWLAILVVAVLNGVVRDLVLASVVGAAAARFISGIVLCLAILVAATLSAGWLGVSGRSRWRVGAMWLFLTLGFEISIGYAQHQTREQLLEAYTFRGGNLWPLVLVTTLIAPWLGARIRRIT